MRRFALRGLRTDDEGLGLLETVLALFVFSLIMTGLAGSMIVFAHSTTLGRARASAASLAQQYVEKARAVGGALLENCSNQTPTPPTTTSFHGKTNLTVVQGADTNCIKYRTTTTQDGLSFSVQRLVILVQPSQNDVAGNAQNEKYFVVQVSWTDAGGVGKTYELDTIFNQKGSLAAAPAQGIRFVIKDINGNILTADSSTWSVVIKDSQNGTTLYTSPDAVTAEGTYSQVDLATGTYWCQAQTTTDASAAYYATASYNSGMTLSSTTGSTTQYDTVGGACSVTASTVTDFVTTWQSSKDCASSTTATGTVNFTVTDKTTGANLNAMTVTLTNLTDSTKTYTKTTGSNGQANGLKPLANWYTYTVTDSTGKYTAEQNSYGPVCIIAGQTFNYAPKMNPVSGCSTIGSNATFNLTVVDANTPTTKLNGYKANLYNATTGAVTAMSNTNAQGLATKAIAPGLYYYMASPPAGNTTYQGSGLQGPVCLAASTTYNYTQGLSAPTCTRGSGPAGKATATTVTIQNMSSINVSGATIVPISLDLDTIPGGTFTTASDGTYTFKNPAPGDTRLTAGPYQFFVTGPNSNYQPKWSLTTFCITAAGTQSVPTITIQGLVNVSVTVQNNDSLAWKTYTVTATNSSGNATTQYVSVPNCTPNTSGCTANPSAAVTFSGLTTGNYVITACSTVGTNCSQVDAAPAQSGGTTTYYTFGTPGATYTSSTTGYGDLAMVDDSGGA